MVQAFDKDLSWVQCFRHVLLEGVPGADPGHNREFMSLSWLGNTMEELKEVARKRDDWTSLGGLLCPQAGQAAENSENCPLQLLFVSFMLLFAAF